LPDERPASICELSRWVFCVQGKMPNPPDRPAFLKIYGFVKFESYRKVIL